LLFPLGESIDAQASASLPNLNVSQIISVSRQSKLMGDNACCCLIMPMATDT
jgi:hypothetical protein